MSKQIKLRSCLVFFYGFEPLDCGGGVFPLVEHGCSHDFTVDSVEDSFAGLSYLRFGGVDQPAGWFVGEVRFVVFEGYECFFVSCLVYSLIYTQFRCDVFVFCVDGLYDIRLVMFCSRRSLYADGSSV